MTNPQISQSRYKFHLRTTGTSDVKRVYVSKIQCCHCKHLHLCNVYVLLLRLEGLADFALGEEMTTAMIKRRPYAKSATLTDLTR